MAKTKDKNSDSATKRPVGRPPKSSLTKVSKSFSQKLDELKLGKFADCEAMSLPEKEPKRGRQILGAIVLMASAILGVVFLILAPPFNYWLNPGPQSFSAFLSTTNFYWNLAALAVIVAVICAAAASLMLFGKKRVPAWLWYILVLAVLAGGICLSFHRFRLYEQRECYKNYPHIIDLDYACPSVVNELSLVVLKDLGLLLVAVAVFWLIRRTAKRAGHRHEKA